MCAQRDLSYLCQECDEEPIIENDENISPSVKVMCHSVIPDSIKGINLLHKI